MMINLLSTRDLIARMAPTALAEMIASVGQAGNLDAVETQTVVELHLALSAIVGCAEAARLVTAARG